MAAHRADRPGVGNRRSRASFEGRRMMPARMLPARMLLICDTYPPVVGGSEIEAQRVSAALMQRGHAVQVLCAGGPPMPPVRNWTDPEGVPVRILTRRSRGRWKDLAFALQVAWIIWKERKKH